MKIGKLVIASFRVDLTAAGAAGVIKVSLPITAAAATFYTVGAAYFFDSSVTQHYILNAVKIDASSLNFVNDVSGANYFGASPAVTIANGDSLTGSITYEAA